MYNYIEEKSLRIIGMKCSTTGWCTLNMCAWNMKWLCVTIHSCSHLGYLSLQPVLSWDCNLHFFKNYKLVHYFWPLLEWVNGYNFYFCFLCHSQIHICAHWNNTVFINVRNHKQEAIKVKYYENNHLSILLVTIISVSVKTVIHWFGNTKLIQMSPATEVLEENWICLLNELVL